jgi:hypothetical protein
LELLVGLPLALEETLERVDDTAGLDAQQLGGVGQLALAVFDESERSRW